MVREGPSCCECRRWISGRRDLKVVDVREGSWFGEGLDIWECWKGTSGRVWTRGKVWGFLLGPAMVQLDVEFVIRLRCFLCGGIRAMILTRVKIWPVHMPPLFRLTKSRERNQKSEIGWSFKVLLSSSWGLCKWGSGLLLWIPEITTECHAVGWQLAC